MSDPTRCAMCGGELELDESREAVPYCATCAIESAEHHVASETPGPWTTTHAESIIDPIRRTRRLRIVMAVSLLAFAAAVAYSLPGILALASADRPLRDGTLNTDAITDACISGLWAAASQMQETGSVDITLTCSASGAVYVLSGSGDDTIISCPNPATHDLHSLSISVLGGVPKAEQ